MLPCCVHERLLCRGCPKSGHGYPPRRGGKVTFCYRLSYCFFAPASSPISMARHLRRPQDRGNGAFRQKICNFFTKSPGASGRRRRRPLPRRRRRAGRPGPPGASRRPGPRGRRACAGILHNASAAENRTFFGKPGLSALAASVRMDYNIPAVLVGRRPAPENLTLEGSLCLRNSSKS